MSATLSTPDPNSAYSEKRNGAKFRLIPKIETFHSVVAIVQTAPGKILLLAVFGFGLFCLHTYSGALWLILAFLALTTFFPAYRRNILAIGSVALLVKNHIGHPKLLFLYAAVLVGGMLLFLVARYWPGSAFGRRPLIFLLSGFSLLIICACTFSYPWLWAMVGALASYIWFIAYALTDHAAVPRKDGSLELTSLSPLWGSTATPFPKGAHYLRRIEARAPEQLAITQLKGLKLLAWAMVLVILHKLWFHLFYGYLQIPTVQQALAMSAHRTPLPWHVQWESQFLSFFENIFEISILGHQFIACCRVAGFNALRNTYRPLSSTTVAEFFNRFYYYFKELLVEFFFFPAFLRYWKGHRRTRLIFANFAAAGFGNAFYHFTRDWQIIKANGLPSALKSFEVYFFYCFILSAGLSISQLRKRNRKTVGFFRVRVLPVCGVILFYSLLEVFDFTPASYSLTEHLRFFANLFFIHF